MNFKKLAPLLPSFLVLILLGGGGFLIALFQSLGLIPLPGMEGFSLSAYEEVLMDPQLNEAIWFSLRISLLVTMVSVVLGFLLALLIRSTKVFSGIQLAALQFPIAVPHMVVALALLFFLSQSGIISRFFTGIGIIGAPEDFPELVFDSSGFGIIFVYLWKELPFIALICLSVIQTTGPVYEEVAQTLGANWYQRIVKVLIPLTLPTVIPATLVVFAFTFSSFDVPLIVGSRSMSMLAVISYRFYTSVHLESRTLSLALAVIMVVIMILVLGLYYAAFRYVLKRGVLSE